MLADKTLLGGTLVVTFLSGSVVGYVGHSQQTPAMPAPHSIDVVYAKEFEALKAKGYDDSEMAEAKAAYKDLFDDYQGWWNQFMETHDAALGAVDKRFHDRMDALADSVEERQGPAKDE